MAPEAMEKFEFSAAADIYSFGEEGRREGEEREEGRRREEEEGKRGKREEGGKQKIGRASWRGRV